MMPADPVRPPSALTKYTTSDLWTVDGDVVPLDSPRTAVYLAAEVDAVLAEIAEEVKAHGEALRCIELLAELAQIREADLRAEVAALTQQLDAEKATHTRVDGIPSDPSLGSTASST